MRRLVVVAATVAVVALGWAWWECSRPVQWQGGWS